jgi:hypothetical protein
MMSSKLAYCLRKLQDFNELEYNVGLSQDIESAKQELQVLQDVFDVTIADVCPYEADESFDCADLDCDTCVKQWVKQKKSEGVS